jgi:hypothetical protein
LFVFGGNITTWVILSALFALLYFSSGVLPFCLELALDYDPPTSTSQVAGITGMFSHIQLVIEIGFC